MTRTWGLAAAVAIALSACTPSGQSVPEDGPSAVPATLPPLDAAAARDRLAADHPDAAAFALFNGDGRGFRFLSDGGVEYRAFRSLTDLRVRTAIASISGNTICLEAVGNWSGACLDLFGTLSGPMRVDVTFGNDSTTRYMTRVAVEAG